MTLPESVLAVLAKAQTMRLATIGPDGAPSLAAFWFHFDGERICFATVENATVRNLRRDPRLAIIVDVGDRIEDLRSVTVKGTAQVFAPREAPPAVRRAIRAINERWAEEIRSPVYEAYVRHEKRAPLLVEIAIGAVTWFDLAQAHRREAEGR